jgi:hypothetical protein
MPVVFLSAVPKSPNLPPPLSVLSGPASKSRCLANTEQMCYPSPCRCTLGARGLNPRPHAQRKDVTMDRLLIGSLEKATTTTGRDVVDLYDVDTRLEYPVLRLFDLSALASVGIDPNELPAGRQYHQFYAYYRQSEKLNRAGRPYRDAVRLEPVDLPATAVVDAGAILTELRAIRALLMAIADHLGLPPPADEPSARQEPGEEPTALADGTPGSGRTYGDGSQPDPSNEAETRAFDSFLALHKRPPSDVAELRRFVTEPLSMRHAAPH